MNDPIPASDIDSNPYLEGVNLDGLASAIQSRAGSVLQQFNHTRGGDAQLYRGAKLVGLFKAFNLVAADLGTTGEEAFEFLADLEDQGVI